MGTMMDNIRAAMEAIKDVGPMIVRVRCHDIDDVKRLFLVAPTSHPITGHDLLGVPVIVDPELAERVVIADYSDGTSKSTVLRARAKPPVTNGTEPA